MEGLKWTKLVQLSYVERKHLPVHPPICLFSFTQCVSPGLGLTITCIVQGFTLSWLPTCWTLEVKLFIFVPSTIMLIFQVWIRRETIQIFPIGWHCILTISLSLRFYYQLWNAFIENLFFVLMCIFFLHLLISNVWCDNARLCMKLMESILWWEWLCEITAPISDQWVCHCWWSYDLIRQTANALTFTSFQFATNQAIGWTFRLTNTNRVILSKE